MNFRSVFRSAHPPSIVHAARASHRSRADTARTPSTLCICVHNSLSTNTPPTHTHTHTSPTYIPPCSYTRTSQHKYTTIYDTSGADNCVAGVDDKCKFKNTLCPTASNNESKCIGHVRVCNSFAYRK